MSIQNNAAPKGKNVWLVSLLIGAVQMIITMDITTLGILLPSINDTFQVSESRLGGILSYGALVFACFMLVGGKLADLYGPRLCISIGLLVVGLGAALATMAPTFSTLLAARALYGFGSALMIPANFALLNTAIPAGAPRQRAYSIFAGVQGLAQFVGPAGGGYLAGTLGWRAFFGANVIFILLLAFMCLRNLPRTTPVRRPFDVAGALMFVPAVALLVLAISGGSGAITSIGTRIAMAAAGLVLIAAFLRSQPGKTDPLLPPSIIGHRGVKPLLLAMTATMAASSALFLLPGLVMQRVLDMSPADAGLGMLPHAIAATVTGNLIGLFMARLSLRTNGLLGMGVLCLGLFINGWMQPQFGYVLNVLVPMVVGAAGSIFTVIMLSALISSRQAEHEQGVTSALMFVCQQVGISLGSTALLTVTQFASTPLAAYNFAFLTAAAIALAGFLAILSVRSEPRATSL